MKAMHLLGFAIILLIQIGCYSSKSGTTLQDENKEKFSVIKGNKMYNPDPSIDLTQHLRKFSGVRVTGQGGSAQIFIRTQAKGHSSVVFFVDGKQMYTYQDAYGLVTGSMLEYIEVLKDASDVAFYGVRGAEGVVNIKTR